MPDYYTDDATALPVACLWRNARRLPVPWSLPLFLVALLRKLLWWRFRPQYASARPEALPEVPAEAVPHEFHEQLRPSVEAFTQQGFAVALYLDGLDIGNREGWSVVLVDASETIVGTVSCVRYDLQGKRYFCTSTGCQSQRMDGQELSTAAAGDDGWSRRMDPPFVDFQPLPAGATVAETVAAHRQRIAAARVVLFSGQSLRRYLIASAHRWFDYMIETGWYARLSEADVERLSRPGATS